MKFMAYLMSVSVSVLQIIFHKIFSCKNVFANNSKSTSGVKPFPVRCAGFAGLLINSLYRTRFMTTPTALQTLQKFRVIIGAVRQHSQELEAACGISGAQVWVLATIAETPEITVSQLSQSISVHVSTASNLLDKLDRAGLVERIRSDKDRRVVRLRLTDAGRDILSRAPRPLTGLVIDALNKMPEAARIRLDADLACLMEHLNRIDQTTANVPLTNLVR
jgi:DNA-binding MarR family transcriptional regulator